MFLARIDMSASLFGRLDTYILDDTGTFGGLGLRAL